MQHSAADGRTCGSEQESHPRRRLPEWHVRTANRGGVARCNVVPSRCSSQTRRSGRLSPRAACALANISQACYVCRVGTAILNSGRDHYRGIVRRAACKFKLHDEGVLARWRRAEKPPVARVLPRPTHQTSQCDAGVNRDERQTIDTTPPRGVRAVVVHGARRGVVAMANRRTPKIPRMRACHVTQTHVRTMPSNMRRRGHGVRRRRSAVRHRDGAASHDVHDDAEDHNGRGHGRFHGHGHGRNVVRVVRARVI